ncbi:N(4)-(beta-N-acetylglucosaminyl)-L-asparaginase [Agriterribacter sp.]|uniref:N(4)-(beta-N-acetylglucosaminyl)-L-asparaginase n=1 Tax=Agriterribacter sp. TaxID=2821509 RepID=UPI002B782185|nr:N(4)-(beta-N-acetylglucosaminyl)-L-asparaginase [Agriterribacter sp.]HRO45394.1 N(4)-(beta-N-acetylglucosaminyl)-L-asparaginase [Agriterribacter sp.]HRQ16914.1 N(4)-(beta-N-acetylglucosaminyl)-L-asparaginase [Agriterribacter sp.]
MSTRRKFLQASVISSAAVLTGRQVLADTATLPIPVINNPVVISTWDFGKAANAGAWTILGKGGRALDAVEAGVKIPEADPTNQSIGYGGLPDRDGHVTLDACIMDEQYNCGSVMALEHIVHAISVARLVMEKTPHIVLAGDGALQFALANGFKKENLLTPESERAWKKWLKTAKYDPVINVENQLYNKENDPMPGGPNNHDTIGMVAMDAGGNLSGACTTSGMAYKIHGRVGDSPIIGAGLYVDNEIGAATSTGVGEEVIRIVGSHLVVELMRQGHSPEAACKEAVQRIIKRSPEKSKKIQVGFLALNKKGEYGAYALQKGFTYAVKSGKEESVYASKSIY